MKIIRVDMTKLAISVETAPPEYTGLGGRGLTSTVINKEVPPQCEALGPDNKLVLAPGLLSGTGFVNTSRLSVGAKSPLTGTIKESNAGGTIGTALGRLGIGALIVEGRVREGNRYLLKVDREGNAALLSAQEYKGMRTYACVKEAVQSYGQEIAMLCVGPAAEYGLAGASIQSTDTEGRPCRGACRGGLGAVMAAKGLKAVIVERRGKNCVALADQEGLRKASKDFARVIAGNPLTGKMLPALGTAGLVSLVNSMGGFPTCNARKGIMDSWESISGETMAGLITERGGRTTHGGCAQCTIRCSNDFVDKGGEYVTASLEYETIWAMGGMTGINDLDVIARLDYLCDDIGVDTMNTGVAIGVAMDAGYRNFGDGDAAIAMVEEIAEGTEFGKVLGNGPVAVGRYLNHNRIPVVKGQSIAGYDPRALQGNAVTYATSPMGADHTAGNVLGEYLGGALDPLKADGQVEASRKTQIAMAFVDCTGLCLFASMAMAAPEGLEALLKGLSAKLGKKVGEEVIPEMGINVLRTEREFNRKAGFTQKDDRLPEFFYREPLLPHNTVVVIDEEQLDETFAFIDCQRDR